MAWDQVTDSIINCFKRGNFAESLNEEEEKYGEIALNV
jgi:hypothetical protein